MKVFISSVMNSFESYRESAKLAVESLEHQPVMAENFGAHPDSPESTCLDKVRKSDVFLLILGESYGWIGETGVSPTEQEYDEAVRNSKDILAFVQKGDKDEKQKQFITKVENYTKGVYRVNFTDPDELKLAVVKALNNLQNRSNTKRIHEVTIADSLALMRQRDIAALTLLLESFSSVIFDNYLDRLNGYIIDGRIFHFYETVIAIVSSGWFQIYDSELREHLSTFVDCWQKAMSFGNLAQMLPSGDYLISPHGVPSEMWESEHERYNIAVDQLIDAYRKWLSFVRLNYIEIDIQRTDIISYREFCEYYSKNE